MSGNPSSVYDSAVWVAFLNPHSRHPYAKMRPLARPCRCNRNRKRNCHAVRSATTVVDCMVWMPLMQRNVSSVRHCRIREYGHGKRQYDRKKRGYGRFNLAFVVFHGLSPVYSVQDVRSVHLRFLTKKINISCPSSKCRISSTEESGFRRRHM